MTPTMCLAIAIYFEARGEPIEGQVAVAEVILNRLASDRREFKGDTVCGIIKQKGHFSFVPKSGELTIPTHSVSWENSQNVAEAVVSGYSDGLVDDALFYANPAATDRLAWTKGLDDMGYVGNHKFWRYP